MVTPFTAVALSEPPEMVAVFMPVLAIVAPLYVPPVTAPVTASEVRVPTAVMFV